MINAHQIRGSDIQMRAGLMTASGEFVASREGQIDGSVKVNIQTTATSMSVPLAVSGVLPDLAVSGRK